MSEPAHEFRAACCAGDALRAERALARINDATLTLIVRGIGGPRALVRFLVQRSHTLHGGSEPLLAWIRRHLHEAEPLHLLDVRPSLQLAVDAGHAAIVRRLVAHLRFVQPPDPTRWSRRIQSPQEMAFLRACRQVDAQRVEDALAADPRLVVAVDSEGDDGLSLVAGSADDDASTVLVSKLLAARHRHPEVALGLAAAPVFAAARSGHARTLALLLADGQPYQRPIHETALGAAALATRVEALPAEHFEAVATCLLAAGADVNAADRWGRTAWGTASPEAQAVLQRLGADPVSTRAGRYSLDTGCTPAMTARHPFPLDRDADDLDVNEAAAVGHIPRLRFLLDHYYGCRPTLRAESGPERPLHLAAWCGQPQIVQTLLTHYGYSPGDINTPLWDGAFVGPPATHHQTALDVAITAGHDRVVDVLMNTVDFFQGRRARRK